MKILNKQFTLDHSREITIEYIENYIQQQGYESLRWAIVEASRGKITIDAAVISNC